MSSVPRRNNKSRKDLSSSVPSGTDTSEFQSDSLYLGKLKFDVKQLKSPIKILFDNTRLLFLLILVLVLGGVASYLTLPRELNPEIEIPIVIVVTTLPGADPLDVENLVTDKLEAEIENLTDISEMTSVSSPSLSSISIQFNSNVDPDKALADVKEKVDLVDDLPDDASAPRINKLDFNNQPVWQVAIVGSVDRRSLSRIAQNVQEKLERRSEVRTVELAGDETEEVVIALDPTALVEHQLTAAQVMQAVETSDLALPAGELTINQTEYQVSVDNDVITVDQLRNLELSLGGQSLKLGQVAKISIQAASSDRITTYVDHQTLSDGSSGKNAVQLDIYKSESATISESVAVANEVLLDELQGYPHLKLVSILNFAEDIETQFSDLSSNFMSTIALVFLVLLLFLGFRQASIAALSIPLTFMSAFIIMSVSGITLNFLSMFSLLLALGLVVDDAIVIVESMHRYSKKFSPTEAGLMVFRDFVVPIWTTTLTTVWAFLPLLLASGIIGEFIKSIPIVVSATLISSTTIAVAINLPLTVLFAQLKVPKRIKLLGWLLGAATSVWLLTSLTAASPLQPVVVACWIGLLLQLIATKTAWQQALAQVGQTVQPKQGVWGQRWQQLRTWWSGHSIMDHGLLDFGHVANKYRAFLYRAVATRNRRLIIYFVSAAYFITSIVFLVTGLLKSEFFPKTDQNTFYINIEGPAGWSRQQLAPIVDEVHSNVLAFDDVSHLVTQTGGLVNDGFSSPAQGPHLAFTTVTMIPETERQLNSIEVADRLRAAFAGRPEAKITVIEQSGGPPAGADLQINIVGDELEQLEQLSDQFAAVVKELPGAINIESSLKPAAGQIEIQLDQHSLQQRGLSVAQVASWLRTAVTGSETTQLAFEQDDLDIVVKLNQSELSLSTLQNLQLPATPGGQNYTLAEVATFSLQTSPTAIEHDKGRRVVHVTAAADGISATELLKQFQTKASDISLPPGYSWTVGGVNEENNKSTASIIQAMGLSAILILVTMVLQLNSFRKSLLVLSVIPLAVAGVFFNFTLLGIPLSFPALIGVLALFGIVVNNSIMLIEKINQNLRFGLPFMDAIVDACASRIEAIFFTTLTTAVGLLPITISDPLWRGLGGAIIAGLTVSGILILVLLPALFVEVFRPEHE